MYKGDTQRFGIAQLAQMEKRKGQQPNIKTPDEVADNLEQGKTVAGATIYNTYCAACHQHNGKGDGTRFPPLAGSEWVTGDKRKLIQIVLNGLNEPITVQDVPYNGLMPAHKFLKDEQVAAVVNYIRKHFNEMPDSVKAEEITVIRKSL
jgi:mono/diheme cytochrome c family protein